MKEEVKRVEKEGRETMWAMQVNRSLISSKGEKDKREGKTEKGARKKMCELNRMKREKFEVKMDGRGRKIKRKV